MSWHGDNAFSRALDEAALENRAPDDGRRRPAAARIRGVPFGVDPGAGGKARFGHALDWTEEPAEPALPPPPRPGKPAPRSPDPSAEIATELGLGAALTLDDLTVRWRAFVWRNHPDRQAPGARVEANGRMAIANALYDQARRALVQG